MNAEKRHRFFRHDKCTLCGECFTRCRYMDLTREEAILEITRLINGEPTETVLQTCASCYSCDAFCREGALPYELILERWDERYRGKGLPERAAYMLPHQQPNYKEDMIGGMSSREKYLLAEWKRAAAKGEILFPGCNLLTIPRLFDLDIFKALPVSGDWSLCCGEPYYRLGAFDVVEQIAKKLTAYYADKRISKMVFVCPACMNMFRSVLPERFGARLDFECEYIVPWLLRKIEAGALKITNPLNRVVTVHDSCHGRVLGDEIMEQTRELYRILGLKIVELKNHHENGLCCGIAAGCNRQMPQDIVAVGNRELKEGEQTGADEMAVYCGGCYLHLGIIGHISRANQKLVHTLELVAEAIGEKMPRIIESRTRKMLINIIFKPLPKMLSLKRFKIEKIKVGPE